MIRILQYKVKLFGSGPAYILALF